MKYFGTDGIRGVVGEYLNKKLLIKVANGIVRFFKGKMRKVLLVGNDSRASSDYILSIIETFLLKSGINVENVGVCSSPCLAFITKKYNYPLAMMISASHNPSEYNGIKFFNSHGEKVDENFEREFERFMDMQPIKKTIYACEKNVEKLKEDYVNFLKSLKKSHIDCILDCANGGTSEIARRVFGKTKIINAEPNGENINKDSGCTHLEKLRLLCAKSRCVSFALDGDGDRLLVVDEFGSVVNGDKILFILSKFYLKSGNSLVGTIYTNYGLEKALNKKHIKLVRAQVGDKLVYAKMCELHSPLGGENAGHIILKPFTNTGDGLLNAIIISNILTSTNLSLRDLLSSYEEYTQIMENLNLERTLTNENLKQSNSSNSQKSKPTEKSQNTKKEKSFTSKKQSKSSYLQNLEQNSFAQNLKLNKNSKKEKYFVQTQKQNNSFNLQKSNLNISQKTKENNLQEKQNQPFVFNQNLRLLINKYESLGARIIIRPSGTEPVLRLMVESSLPALARDAMEKLKEEIMKNC